MKRIILLCSLLVSIAYSLKAQYTSTSFYIVGHPDDWQLFMGVDAFNHIVSGTTGNGSKVVIIYTTAGDGSFGNYPYNVNYYQVRQSAANRSVQYCSDTHTAHSVWKTGYFTFNIDDTLHNILRMTYKNVVCYYLLLPDGCGESGNINSLSKLAYTYGAPGFYNNYCACTPTSYPTLVQTITTVDSTTTYNSYDDLKKTISSIMKYESAGISEVYINSQETDQNFNPQSHPDHIQTGFLATDIANMALPCSNLVLYEDYHTCSEEPDMTPQEIAMKAGLLSQISFARTTNNCSGEWDPAKDCGHVSWTSRNYFRTVRSCDTFKTGHNEVYTNLFPNPATSEINISYMVFEISHVEITLYDIYGRQLSVPVNETKGIGSYTQQINIRNLATGNYIIFVKTSKYINELKFIKK